LTVSRRGDTFQPVDFYDYSRRGYLLPDGCKDLIDVIQPKKDTTHARDFFFVTIQLPELENADAKILVEGNTIWVVAEHAGKHASYKRKIEVPSGFAAAKAKAIYMNDRLYITVPKVTA
jgi:HSP20 family molecular chaperone IbpA